MSNEKILLLSQNIAFSKYRDCQTVPIKVGGSSSIEAKVIAKSKKFNISFLELPIELNINSQIGGLTQVVVLGRKQQVIIWVQLVLMIDVLNILV